jgi:hypothetical protein
LSDCPNATVRSYIESGVPSFEDCMDFYLGYESDCKIGELIDMEVVGTKNNTVFSNSHRDEYSTSTSKCGKEERQTGAQESRGGKRPCSKTRSNYGFPADNREEKASATDPCKTGNGYTG